MRGSMMKFLFQGTQRYKNVPHHRTILGFNNTEEIRSIRMTHSMTQTHLLSKTDERNALMAIWPELVTDLTEKLYPDIPEATKWMAEILNYNVPYGGKRRGLCAIYAYRMLAHPKQLTEENLKLARILAWCLEMNAALLLMQDDLMDRSKTRGGQPCWYLRDNIGVTAVNDALIVEYAAYQLLETHFSKRECYVDLWETFTKATLKVGLGQVMDISTSNYGSKPNINLFSMERYNRFTKYSGAHYFYFMPVKLAMHLAGITDPEMYRQMETILLDLGHLGMPRYDYLDCYGDPNVTGKIGTDIQLGKCTWLIATALQHATPSQRKILQECYGYDNPEKIARVKQVYDELDMPTLLANYREKTRKSIKSRINQMTCDFPKDLFDVLMVMDED